MGDTFYTKGIKRWFFIWFPSFQPQFVCPKKMLCFLWAKNQLGDDDVTETTSSWIESSLNQANCKFERVFPIKNWVVVSNILNIHPYLWKIPNFDYYFFRWVETTGGRFTLPKFNIDPAKWWLEELLNFGGFTQPRPSMYGIFTNIYLHLVDFDGFHVD